MPREVNPNTLSQSRSHSDGQPWTYLRVFSYLTGMSDTRRNDPNNFSALDPGDELYREMPQHVKDVYRRAKAFRRQEDREAFALARAGGALPPGLRAPQDLGL